MVNGEYGYAAADISRSQLTKLADGSYKLVSKTGIVSSFNAIGILTSREDATGNVISYSHEDKDSDLIADELVAITDAFGRSITFGYTSGTLGSITHFSGKVTTVTILGNALTAYELEDPDGAATNYVSPIVQFDYGTPNELKRENSVLEVTTFVFGSSDGRLREVQTAKDAFTSAAPEDIWKIVPGESRILPAAISPVIASSDSFKGVVTDQRLNTWEFKTDRFGGITERTTPLGYQSTILRNSDGLIYKYVEPDPDGPSDPQTPPTSFFGYSSRLDGTCAMAADGGVTRTTFTPNYARIESVVDPVGRLNLFGYDGKGNLTTVTDGDNFVTSLDYTAQGLLKSVTSPDPDGSGPKLPSVTSMLHDSFGRLQTTVNPDSSTVGFTYNTADQIESITDELGHTTYFTFDDLGRNDTVVDRLGAVAVFGYDALSRVTSARDPLLHTTSIEYSHRGWVDAVIFPDPDGASGLPNPVNDLEYDGNGNLVGEGYAGGNFTGQTPYEYDEDNRLVKRGISESPVKEELGYDFAGRLTSIRRVQQNADRSLASSDYVDEMFMEYDPSGRLSQRKTRLITTNGTGPEESAEGFVYNAAGELITQTDGNGNSTHLAYNGRGLLTQMTLPNTDGSEESIALVVDYDYDSMGRLQAEDWGFGRVTTYDYNSRSWRTKVTEADPDGLGQATAPVTSFAYNARGDLTRQQDPLARITSFEYDNEQRLEMLTEPDPDGAGTQQSPVTRWEYWANGWLKKVINPRLAEESFEYDGLGRVTVHTAPDPDDAGNLLAPVTNFEYDVFGLHKIIDPMQGVTQFNRDTRGLVETTIDTAGASTTYTYKFYDQVLRRDDPDPDGIGPGIAPSFEYFYDADGRLEQEKAPNGSTFYTYDLASNLETLTDPNSIKTKFEYDGLNRLTKETVLTNSVQIPRQYEYDAAGNLARTIDRNGKVIHYEYDALDRLVEEYWSPNTSGVAEIDVTVQQEGGPGTPEVQVIEVIEPASSTLVFGHWYISFDGQVTEKLYPNGTAATLEQSLEQIVGSNNVVVTGGPTSQGGPAPYTVTFSGNLAAVDVPTFEVDDSHLRVNAQNTADGHLIVTEYNAANEVTGITEYSQDPFIVLRDKAYVRDDLGRPEK